MSQDFQPGDFLIFQVEAGFGLLRLLGFDSTPEGTVWHISAYTDMFPDSEFADRAIQTYSKMRISIPHVALTNRAFESTQTARMENIPLTAEETAPLSEWRSDENKVVSDRSVRLLLGLR